MSLKQKIENALGKTTPDALLDPALPMTWSSLQRIEIEFYCQMCRHYIYLTLNITLMGNHIIICPLCTHKHYRVVKNGIITGDRFEEGYDIVDEIIPMKSAAVPIEQRRVRGTISLLREMEACGILK